MDIITIQSRVTWGYVGNAIAVPILQALGTNAWAVNTVRLSHHPGHGTPWRRAADTDELSGLLSGAIDKAGPSVGVLMGYLGTADQGRAALRSIEEHQASGHHIPFYLDPAFGDDPDGTYVDHTIVEFYRDTAIQHADVVMPNRYELATLSGHDVASVSDAIVAARLLISSGCKSVMASSIPASGDTLANVFIGCEATYMCESKRIPLRSKGTGDLLSAAFCGYHSAGHTPDESLGLASAIVQTACAKASADDLVELDLIDLLDEIHNGITPHAVTQLA